MPVMTSNHPCFVPVRTSALPVRMSALPFRCESFSSFCWAARLAISVFFPRWLKMEMAHLQLAATDRQFLWINVGTTKMRHQMKCRIDTSTSCVEEVDCTSKKSIFCYVTNYHYFIYDLILTNKKTVGTKAVMRSAHYGSCSFPEILCFMLSLYTKLINTCSNVHCEIEYASNAELTSSTILWNWENSDPRLLFLPSPPISKTYFWGVILHQHIGYVHVS